MTHRWGSPPERRRSLAADWRLEYNRGQFDKPLLELGGCATPACFQHPRRRLSVRYDAIVIGAALHGLFRNRRKALAPSAWPQNIAALKSTVLCRMTQQRMESLLNRYPELGYRTTKFSRCRSVGLTVTHDDLARLWAPVERW